MGNHKTETGIKYDLEYRKRPKTKAILKEWRMNHPDYGKEWRKNHPLNMELYYNKIKEDSLRIKKIVLCYYSGDTMKCTCCGESNFKFLSLDHEDNNGYEHRKVQRGGIHLYKLLIKLGFPPGYTVLCMNCNFGKGQNNGICPHLD